MTQHIKQLIWPNQFENLKQRTNLHNIHTRLVVLLLSNNTASANCLTEKGKENTYLQKKKPLLVSCEFHFLVFLKCCGAGEKKQSLLLFIYVYINENLRKAA